MKKYFLTSAAALAFCGLFTSCTHDLDYDGEAAAAQNSVVKTYEQAFVTAFGQPDPNQEWGFGSKNSSTRAFTRVIQPTFNFPNDADGSKFLGDVPASVNSYSAECAANNQTDGYAAGTSYVDPTWTGQVNIWGAWDGSKSSGGTLYIKGENDFTNRKFYVAANTEIYLVKNAVLKLSSSNASDLQSNCKFYLADSAKIITDAELVLNNGLHIYNHGTIEANKLHANSNSVLYNVGTVKVTTKISVENDLSVIVNDGKITAADLNTAGSGKFENNGQVTISGTTFVNSNNNTWVNNGQYKTKYFLYYAGSDEVINNCKLIVDEDFTINLGDNPGNGNFKMDAGSSVVTKNFNGGGNWTGMVGNTYINAQGGPFYIYMGANSVFKVTETATMNATKANYGIYGPADGGYAVFQAKNIVMGKENQGFEVTYGNNLYVYASESHFANGNDGQADHPYIDFKGNAKIYAPGFQSGTPDISIATTPCNPGFNTPPTPPTPPTPSSGKLRIICEDLSAKASDNENSDWDFNDVVFDIQLVENNTKAEITLLAAGGTLPLCIGDKDHEVHELFAEANPGKGITTSTMINTRSSGEKYTIRDCNEKTFQLDIQEDWKNGADLSDEDGLLKAVAKNMPVQVYKMVNGTKTWVTMECKKGDPAAKIAVGTDYIWCDERTDIRNQFKPTNHGNEYSAFKLYVKSILGDGWYNVREISDEQAERALR